MAGRSATDAVIPGQLAISVGNPETALPKGWQWVRLLDVATLESGHTPSRRERHYWDGDVPWLGIVDAREHHGQTIYDTAQSITLEGLRNSSARLLPKGTVCLSRTASVGYALVLGRQVATSQDFVNWICSAALLPKYLMYSFMAEGRAGLARFGKGTVHTTIYFPAVKAFHIALPPLKEQIRIVDALETAALRAHSVRRRIAALDAPMASTHSALVDSLVFGASGVNDAGLDCHVKPTEGRGPRGGGSDVPKLLPSWRWGTLGEVMTGFEAGRSPKAKGQPAIAGEPGVLKVSAVSWGAFDPTANKALLPDDSLDIESTIQAGDLIINRANTTELVGAAVLVESDFPDLMLSDKTLRICYLPEMIHPRFLLFALRTSVAKDYFQSQASGTSASMKNLSQRKLRGTPIPIPPLEKQIELADKLQQIELRLGGVRRRLAGLVELLAESMQTVLRTAFTGKLVPSDPSDEPISKTISLSPVPSRLELITPLDSTMSKKLHASTPSGLREAINAMPTDDFLSDQLRAEVSGGYERFQESLFKLLGQHPPLIVQRFEAGRMKLRRLS